jgi:hypothetical protein
MYINFNLFRVFEIAGEDIDRCSLIESCFSYLN